MISLIRTRVEADIPKALQGSARVQREAALLKLWHGHVTGGKMGKVKWNTNNWKVGKPLLKKESHEKCAYCESPTATVAHGDVEHFRPKSQYWWLAYCLDNHLFSCQICNQSYKGDQFPRLPGGRRFTGPRVRTSTSQERLLALKDTFAPDPVAIGAGYALSAFLSACIAERPGLPDPYNCNPELNFKWRADAVNKEVWLEARTHSKRLKFVLKSVETALGLNREELRRWRWKLAYQQLEKLRAMLEEIDRERKPAAVRRLACDSIRDMMGDGAAYAGMVRYFVRVAWTLSLT